MTGPMSKPKSMDSPKRNGGAALPWAIFFLAILSAVLSGVWLIKKHSPSPGEAQNPKVSAGGEVVEDSVELVPLSIPDRKSDNSASVPKESLEEVGEVVKAGGNSEVLRMLADYYNDDPDAIADDLRKAWPRFFEIDLKPLIPWEEFQPVATDRIIEHHYGESPRWEQIRFEEAVLMDSIPMFLDKHKVLEEKRKSLTLDVRESIDSCWDPYLVLKMEYSLALRFMIQSERIDRWPYVTLKRFRKHTRKRVGEEPLIQSATALKGGWVVQANLYASDFPSLETAMESWNQARKEARTRANKLVGGS